MDAEGVGAVLTTPKGCASDVDVSWIVGRHNKGCAFTESTGNEPIVFLGCSRLEAETRGLGG